MGGLENPLRESGGISGPFKLLWLLGGVVLVDHVVSKVLGSDDVSGMGSNVHQWKEASESIMEGFRITIVLQNILVGECFLGNSCDDTEVFVAVWSFTGKIILSESFSFVNQGSESLTNQSSSSTGSPWVSTEST